MRAMAAIGVMAVLAAAIPAAADPNSSLGAGCDDAVARGVWELAIDLCSPELLPADAPDETKARVLAGRARAYEETGDAARSAADAAEAEKLDPGSAAKAEAARAQRLVAKDELQQSLKAIEGLWWDRGEEARALTELDRIITQYPRSAQAYALRASIYLARRDEIRAKADIAQATSLSKNCELKVRATKSYVLSCPEPGVQ